MSTEVSRVVGASVRRRTHLPCAARTGSPLQGAEGAPAVLPARTNSLPLPYGPDEPCEDKAVFPLDSRCLEPGRTSGGKNTNLIEGGGTHL